MKNKELKILLSSPRGFCAGVERAIEIVEKSIKNGARRPCKAMAKKHVKKKSMKYL